MENRIPAICDRCRAEGVAGEAAFADLGDLLDFEPVPRRPRVDGWTAEVQRAFIAALAVTGSERQAAHAVGKAQFGVEQLKKAKGNEGFMAAREHALAMAQQAKSRRLAAGLHAVTAPAAHWRPPEPAWSRAATRQQPFLPGTGARGAGRSGDGGAPQGEAWGTTRSPEDKETAEDRLEWLDRLVGKYLLKVRQEREARLAGEVVTADYYVRQMTHIEVMLDLMGTGGFKVLKDFRMRGHGFVAIAETPMSRILGMARRRKWIEMGEPLRPEHPPGRYLVEHDGFSTEPLEYTEGGLELSHEEQRQRFEERHRQDAAEQIEWEAEARRDYDRRRAGDAAS